MKRMNCLPVIVMTMLTASVCVAAPIAGGYTKYFARCNVQVNGPRNMIWAKMPAFILTVKNDNGTPGQARVDVYTENGNRIETYNVRNKLELKPRIVAKNYYMKITPVSSANMRWRIEKNPEQYDFYRYELSSQKNTKTKGKTSQSSQKSGGSPFDVNLRVKPAGRR